MNDKKDINLSSLYLIIGLTGLSLIVTGCCLDMIFSALNVTIAPKIVLIFKIAFILSGLGDFGILLYAKNKLS